MTFLINLRRYLALADCELVDSFGRVHRIAKGMGGIATRPAQGRWCKPASLRKCRSSAILPPGGVTLPTFFSRRGFA